MAVGGKQCRKHSAKHWQLGALVDSVVEHLVKPVVKGTEGALKAVKANRLRPEHLPRATDLSGACISDDIALPSA